MDSKRDVVAFLMEYLEIGEEELIPEADLVDDLGVDPGEMVSLVRGLGKRLSIEVSDEEISKVRTVQDLVNLAESYA